MKKIAVIYQGTNHPGGIETYLNLLFSNIDKNVAVLTLVSLGKWKLAKELAKNDEKVIEISFRWYQFYKILKLKNIFLAEDFDLIVTQGLVANFYGRISSYLAKIPNLVTVHSNYDFDFHGPKKMLYWITSKLFGFITIKYIVVSKYLKKQTEKLGVNAEKIAVIYNGISSLGAKPKKRTNKVVIGSIGRLHYSKGFHNLIEAIRLLDSCNLKLYIWGTGEEKEDLEGLIRKYRLTEKISLEGYTANISDSLSKVDIYVQPSLSEGFGLTVVEAMFAEKPIVVTPAGALPELITDGMSGIVAGGFTPEAIATALKVLIDDDKLGFKLATEARKVALDKFNLDKWIKMTEKVFLETAK